MLSPVVRPPGLVTGERLTVEEFLRRWEDLPDLKNAELIAGVVYVPSPVSREHSHLDARIILWLAYYAQATPGCESGSNSTWLMAGSAPQPDADLCILPSHGGQSANLGSLATGAPELAVEICVTSAELDLGPKRALYQRAGVREYITIEAFGPRMIWRVLKDAEPIPLWRPRRTAFSGRNSFRDCGWTRPRFGRTMARRCWPRLNAGPSLRKITAGFVERL